MPYKYNASKRHHIKKHTYRLTNHSDYNKALKNRGRINIWISDDILNCWQEDKRIYDGTGSTVKYPNSTIEACYYLRMVFKFPLRQTQGFIENILEILGQKNLQCPDYTLLSKRLSQLGFDTPKFKRDESIDKDIVAIAIDSTGLKRFGKDECHQPKRMSNLVAYMALGVAKWQKLKHYGWRNVSEMAMQRYKKIIGSKLHSRKFSNQQQEMLIGCSILNRFTHLGMPKSYRVA